MHLTPVALFVYNRIWHTKQTVEALAKNHFADETTLYIFSDGSRDSDDLQKILELRSYLKSIQGFKKIHVIEREENYGLAESIIKGVTEVLLNNSSVIVIEDDLVTSSFFLKYINEALTLYESNESVASIHGYVYPVDHKLDETFFLRGADCWGWGTWKSRWEKFNPEGEILLESLINKGLASHFNFNNTSSYIQMLKDQIQGKNNSWAIRWYASMYLENMYTLYPGYSLVKNIGHDCSGTHCVEMNHFDVELLDRPLKVELIPVQQSEEAFIAFSKYFSSLKVSLLRRMARKIFKMFFHL